MSDNLGVLCLVWILASLNMFSKLCQPLDTRVVRRRGGWRQQLASQTRVDENPPPLSKLASGLLLEFCDGNLSATRLWQHCSNAKADGLTHPMVLRLAQVGSEDSKHRCHSGVMKLLDSCGFDSLLTTLEGTVSHAMLPSSYVKVMQSLYAYDFAMRMGADETKITEFWNGFFWNAKEL